MSKTNNLVDFLTDVADSIRYAAGISDKINAQNFSDEIKKINQSNISVNLTSNTTLSGKDLNDMRVKQARLCQAIDSTIIDNEVVYKMEQQENEDRLDLIMYTKEGDTLGYYYVWSKIDDHLSKVYISM